MKQGGERLDELPANRMGDGDTALRRRLLQADDEADRGAEPVLTLNEDVGEADAAANEERRFAAPGVPLGHGGLKRQCPAHRILDVLEFDEGAVAHGLEEVAAMGGEGRPDDFQAHRRQFGQRPALVAFDMAGVPGNVERSQNRQLSRRHAHCQRSPIW